MGRRQSGSRLTTCFEPSGWWRNELLVVAGQLTKGIVSLVLHGKPWGRTVRLSVYGERSSARRVQAKLARVATGVGSVAASSQVVATERESSLAVASKHQTELPRGHVAVDDWFCGHCGVAADAQVSSYSDLCFSDASVPFSSRLAALFGGAFTEGVTSHSAEQEFKRRVEQTPPARAVASFKEASAAGHCVAQLHRLRT